MKNTKTLSILLILFMSFGFAACSSVNDNEDLAALTPEDLEVAAQTIGDTFSDEGGVITSMKDAISTVDESGFGFNITQQKSAVEGGQMDDDRSGRGRENSFSYDFDPETGVHTVDFNRSFTAGVFSSTVSNHLEYIFTNIDGSFNATPRATPEDIESIDFKGNRSGTKQILEAGQNGLQLKNTSFQRIDTLLYTGLHSSSPILGLTGSHRSNGFMQARLRNGREFGNTFRIQVEFTDIQIDKAVVRENVSLEQGVTGSVSYTMFFTRANGDNQREKSVEGEIIFEGDGTGLLRFRRFAQVFRFDLQTGNLIQ